MSPRNIRIFPPLAATALIIATLAGCSVNDSSSSSAVAPPATDATALEEPDLTIAAVPSADLAGVYIAQDDGFFARQGLHVKLVKIAASKAVIAAQLAGKVDLCAGAYMPYIAGEAAGDKFGILAEGSIMTPGTRLLLKPRGSGVASLGQLPGKTIGMNAANSIGTLLVDATLAQNGINPATVTQSTDPKGFPTMAATLSRGTWSAAFFGEPFATEGEEKYGETVLADLDQGAAKGLPISGYIATRSWIDKHPKTAAAFIRAIEQAQLAADSDPSVARAALAKSDGLPHLVTDVMAIPEFPVGAVDETRIEREALDMLQFGMLGRKYAPATENGTLVKSMLANIP